MDHKQVSFDSELLILVDEDDNKIGYKPKSDCHQGEGILHRAFSIFIFNGNGEILLQKRGADKALWPLFWSNACCSHPRKGESYETATKRRLEEELGLQAELRFLYKFQYQANYLDKGSENELCAVYMGRSEEPIRANPYEIDEWKFVTIDELNRDLAENPDRYTPWFKMEWSRIQEKY
ncbi:MAG: isopentenyl-diphosphate delta-isomerase [Candidatus Cloacimonetes bacterium 4572_55]|nr:MAG: isopentenyl-diphosphate delta-isomerase [Candidatus Cloacimonetes bacterium 4572_55]